MHEDELPRSIHGVLGVMSSELNCAICLQLFEDAQTAPCWHVFCRDCILRALQQRTQCPLCKQPVNRRQLQDSLLGLIAKEFGELRAIYEHETGAGGTMKNKVKAQQNKKSLPSSYAQTCHSLPNRHDTRHSRKRLNRPNKLTRSMLLNPTPNHPGTRTLPPRSIPLIRTPPL